MKKEILLVVFLLSCGVAFAGMTIEQEIAILKNDRDTAQARLDVAIWAASVNAIQENATIEAETIEVDNLIYGK